MNIATIRGMVEKDLKIDSTELDLASLRIPQLHNKYLNIFHDERLLLKKMKIDFKELRVSHPLRNYTGIQTFRWDFWITCALNSANIFSVHPSYKANCFERKID